MVGTVILTAFPAVFPVPLELFQSSVARFVASYACRIAGPAARVGFVSLIPDWLESMPQTIPLVVPDDETDGVTPGKPKVVGDCETGVVVNRLVKGFTVKTDSGALKPAI